MRSHESEGAVSQGEWLDRAEQALVAGDCDVAGFCRDRERSPVAIVVSTDRQFSVDFLSARSIDSAIEAERRSAQNESAADALRL